MFLIKRSLFALLVAFMSATLVAEENGPHEVLERAAEDLVRVIEEGKGYYDQDPQRFYREIRDVLDPVVDFVSFARSVMGPHGQSATPAQRQRFIDTFKDSLISTYGRALLNFNGEEIRIVRDDRPARDPERRSVRMEVHTADGRVFPLTYAMQQDNDGRWRVRNIIVEGINIGLTYRNQFNSAMRAQRDLDIVIDEWGETIAAADPVASELEAQ
jgi:phospholipid transport system substrate-binding protein